MLGVPQEKLKVFIERAKELDQPAWNIGKVKEGEGIRVK
jgi:hypothetical protein